MNKPLRYLAAVIAFWLASASLATAQPRRDPEVGSAPPKPYTVEEAAAYLDKFRHSWFGSDVGLQFNLIHTPRRGDDITFPGMAWSTWMDNGPVTRIQLLKPSATKGAKPEVWEWLLQSGPSPHVWVLAPGVSPAQEVSAKPLAVVAPAVREVPPSEWREPFLPGLLYTPFDLMVPFLYWTDFKYNGTDRILHRGVDVYTMNPPPAEKAAGIHPVKIFIDRELDALVRTQELDDKGAVVLQFDLDKVAKVQGKWMLQSCNLIEVDKGNYDQFVVRMAAVPGEATPFKLDPAIFLPSALGQPVPALPQAAWVGL